MQNLEDVKKDLNSQESVKKSKPDVGSNAEPKQRQFSFHQPPPFMEEPCIDNSIDIGMIRQNPTAHFPTKETQNIQKYIALYINKLRDVLNQYDNVFKPYVDDINICLGNIMN